MKKNFQILLRVILISLFFACEQDDYIPNESTNKKLTGQKLTYKQLTKNSNLIKKINKLPSTKNAQKDHNGKIIYSSENDFYINTDLAIYLEDENGNHSYTFQVFRENATFLLENIVLRSRDSLGYDLLLAQYDITQTEYNQLQNGEIINVSDKIILSDIDDNSLVSDITNKVMVILGNIILYCDISSIYTPISDDPECSCYFESVLFSNCESLDGGDSSNNSGEGGSWDGTFPGDEEAYENDSFPDTSGSGGVNTNSGSQNDSNQPDGCKGCNNIFIYTSPVVEEEEIKKDPCDKVKKLLSKPNMQSEISSMATKTSEPNEWGRYKLTSSSVIQTPPSTSAGAVDFPIPASGQYTMIAHTHNSPASSTYSIFSWMDLEGLATLIRQGKVDTQKFVAFLATADGTYYALTIEDPSAFSNFFATAFDTEFDLETGKIRAREMNTYYDPAKIGNPIIKENNSDNLADEKAFLTFLQDNNLGVTLFEANSDFTTFEKVSYDKLTDDIQKTPCN